MTNPPPPLPPDPITPPTLAVALEWERAWAECARLAAAPLRQTPPCWCCLSDDHDLDHCPRADAVARYWLARRRQPWTDLRLALDKAAARPVAALRRLIDRARR